MNRRRVLASSASLAAGGRFWNGGGVRAWLVLAWSILAVFSASSCRQLLGLRMRVACGDAQVIDNFEDDDDAICQSSGRQGVWFVASDGTGSALSPAVGQDFAPTEIPAGREGSHYAARLSGAGFTNWGALLGVVLNETTPGKGQPYNAGKNIGIKFWLKANTEVSVAFPTLETAHESHGGTCVGNHCDNDFQFLITAPKADEWVEYQVPFSALVRAGGGNPAAWDPSHLLSIQFVVSGAQPFELWVDDVRFFSECLGARCLPTCKDPSAPLACPATVGFPASCRPAGTDCSTPISVCGDDLMLDDLEDGDALLCQSPERQGVWWVANDGTPGSVFEPPQFTPTWIPGGRGTSHYAAHFSGSGFTHWGAVMGFHLNQEGLVPQPYNLGTTAVLKFWMKSTAPVSVAFPMPETTRIDEAGTCKGEFADGCDDHFQFQIAAPTPNAWAEYSVPFEALTRLGRGGSATWNPSRIVSISFGVGAGAPFDVWIDDVRLDYCPPTGCLLTCSDPAAPIACPASSGFPPSCAPTEAYCAAAISNLHEVWGSPAGDVLVTGSRGDIAHWDGSAWSPLAETATTEILEGVWGGGPGNVWAVGENGAVVHWDGSRWSSVPSGTTRSLESVWGSGPRDIWAVGFGGTIVHWDGVSWSPFSSGTTQDLIGTVWGTGPADVWAVGGAGTIAHWNGSAWSASQVAGFAVLFGIWGSGPNDVWAVGGDFGKGAGIVHWNGTVWTATAGGTTQPLFGVWGSGPNDVWAVGSEGTIVHWDGSTWSPSASGTTQQLFDAWGSGPSDVWVVGRNGTLLHWDGSAWSRRYIPRI